MIRRAVAVDRPAVEGVVQAAYAPWIDIIGGRPLPMDADYAELIAAGQVWVLDPLDGLIVLVPEDGVLLIENVAVSPSAQGRGLGRRLLAFAEQHARALDLSTLRLYTNEKMVSNIALYERLGYVATQREYINGRYAVHMRKLLPPT
jgi:ribosomal protein S18 acetylase RimI-like enzyme